MTTIHLVQRCVTFLVVLLLTLPLAAQAQDQVRIPPDQRRRRQDPYHRPCQQHRRWRDPRH